MDVQQSGSCRHPDGRSSRSGMVLAGRSRILPPFFRDGHPGQKSMPNWPESPGRLWLRPARFVSPAAGAARSASSIFCWPLAACCRAVCCCCWPKWTDLTAASVDDEPYVRASAAGHRLLAIIRAVVTDDRCRRQTKNPLDAHRCCWTAH